MAVAQHTCEQCPRPELTFGKMVKVSRLYYHPTKLLQYNCLLKWPIGIGFGAALGKRRGIPCRLTGMS